MFEQEPQDIFAGTDKPPAVPAQPSIVERASIAPPPKLAPAVAPVATATQSVASPLPLSGGVGGGSESTPHPNLVRNIVIIIVAIVVVAGGAYAAYALMIKPIMSVSVAPVVTQAPVVTPETPAVVPPVETPVATPTPVVPAVPGTVETLTPPNLNPTFLDSDGDGLNNADELSAGTSSTNPDTDGDGLGDREEVKVYGTDPLRTDTDGDGFLDGAEVQGGYNPNGPGKLLQIPTTP